MGDCCVCYNYVIAFRKVFCVYSAYLFLTIKDIENGIKILNNMTTVCHQNLFTNRRTTNHIS